MFIDCVQIFLAAFLSAIFAEAISWLLIYRTESYQKLKSSVDRLQRKLDRKKEVGEKGKKIDRYEEALKTTNREMSMTKIKSTFAIGITMISLFGFLNSAFDGVVVAKLPFEPFGFISGLTHRNIPGSDLTDCSMVFFYILSSTCIRSNLQKILGTSPPRQSGAF